MPPASPPPRLSILVISLACALSPLVPPAARARPRAHDRPSFSAITRLATAQGLDHVAIHGSPLPVEGPDERKRWVAVVSSSERAPESHDDVREARVVVLSKAEGAWAIADSLVLPIAPRANMYVDRRAEDFTIAAWRAEDVDRDGRPEVTMSVDWLKDVICGPGQLWGRQFFVLNLDPHLSLGFGHPLAEWYESGSHTERGHVELEDANGDGHPDIRLRARTCEPTYTETFEATERCAPAIEEVFPWDAARDVWAPPPPMSGGPGQPCS